MLKYKHLVSDASILFTLCCLFGGMGWILAPLQLRYIPAEMAVGYRFLVAGFITLGVAMVWRQTLRPVGFIPQIRFFVQGLCMFSINYILAYYALHYVLSGVVAVILSTLVIPNTLMERFFFKKPYTKGKFISTLIGLVGVIILFFGDYTTKNFGTSLGKGILFCGCSMIFTSLGANLSQLKFKKNDDKSPVDPVWTVGFAMTWGGFITLLLTHFVIQELYFPLEKGFILPLIGLTILSALIFILYQILLAKKGAGFAAYVWVITPGIALILSCLFEGLVLTLHGALGICIILLGGYLNLRLQEKRI